MNPASYGRAVAQAFLTVSLLAIGIGCDRGTGPDRPAIARLTVQPAVDTLSVGDTARFTAAALAEDGTPVEGVRLAWESSAPGVAAVDSTGRVSALAAGSAVISVSGGGKQAVAMVFVDSLVRSPVRGYVRQRNGEPVPGATVTVRSYRAYRCGGAEFRSARATTDAGGLYRAVLPMERDGWDCVEVAVEPPAGSGLLADTLRAAFRGDIVQLPIHYSVNFALNPANPPEPPPGALTFRAVSAGAGHTCAIAQDGAAHCWGGNRSGQLGTDGAAERCLAVLESWRDDGATIPCASHPLRVAGGLDFDTLRAGSVTTCGVAAAVPYCWGAIGGNPSTPTRIAVPAPVRWIGLAWRIAGCALATDGRAFCWPDGSPPGAAPVPLSDSLRFQAITEGDHYACGITPASRAYCWGSGDLGELGGGRATFMTSEIPEPVVGGLLFRKLSAGASSACGVTPAGQAYCWGADDRGQLGSAGARESCVRGINNLVPCIATPVPVSGDVAFEEVSVGGAHACGLTASGTAYCWGDNRSGQLGLGARDTLPHRALERVPSAIRFVAIDAGDGHTCAIAATGGLYCWGSNRYGQLGEGSLADRASPTRVAGSAP